MNEGIVPVFLKRGRGRPRKENTEKKSGNCVDMPAVDPVVCGNGGVTAAATVEVPMACSSGGAKSATVDTEVEVVADRSRGRVFRRRG